MYKCFFNLSISQMNIFVLDENPMIAANYHCDKHVNKMILETAQMLCSNYYTLNSIHSKKEIEFNEDRLDIIFDRFPRKNTDNTTQPYGIGFYNHPCTKWLGKSSKNFEWGLQLGLSLTVEYTERYSKIHSVKKIFDWIESTYINLQFESNTFTEFALAMPDIYKVNSVVESYRNYYCYEKSFAKWKLGNIPYWYINKK